MGNIQPHESTDIKHSNSPSAYFLVIIILLHLLEKLINIYLPYEWILTLYNLFKNKRNGIWYYKFKEYSVLKWR